MLVTILSISKHTPDNEHSVFHIINDGISKENVEFLQTFSQRYSLEIVYIDGTVLSSALAAQNFPKWRGGYTAYLKMLAINGITDAHRILYLDSDIIVKRDISDIFSQLDGSECPIAMAEDMTVSYNPAYKKYILGEDCGDRPYYNVGTILFDVDRWKEQNCEKRIFDFMQSNKKPFMYFEQDIMNILFRDNTVTLSNTYNYCTPILYFKPKLMGEIFGWNEEQTAVYASMQDNYAIGHCFGVFQQRPWHKDSRQPLARDYKELYEEIYEKPFIGAPAPIKLYDKAQYLLYRVCRPMYKVLHKIFTKRMYKKFIDQYSDKI